LSISLKTRKMLWGRSANRCNHPDCRRELVMDATETDDESIIGEECHIIAQEENGPRGNSNFTKDERDKYSNLILMCHIHHKIIDDQPNTYSVKVLTDIKRKHEEWVRDSLNIDKEKQHEDEIYSSYIEEWCNLTDINNWNGWTSYMISDGQPKISKEMDTKLNELSTWMLSRIWFKRYIELEESLKNFQRVLGDLYNTFHEHSTEYFDMFITDKFYKINRWDEKLYANLVNEYNFHVDLVEDLVLELTRAANYVCDNVRRFLLPSFRVSEGLLLVTYGPCMDLSFKTVRTEYRGQERILQPYPGLERFKEVRTSRDFCFGAGKDA